MRRRTRSNESSISDIANQEAEMADLQNRIESTAEDAEDFNESTDDEIANRKTTYDFFANINNYLGQRIAAGEILTEDEKELLDKALAITSDMSGNDEEVIKQVYDYLCNNVNYYYGNNEIEDIQDKAALLGTHGKIDKITDSAHKNPGILLYYTDALSIEKTDEGYDIRLTDGEEVNEFFFDGSYNFVEAIGKQQPIALTRSDIIGCIDKIKTVSEMYKAFGTPHADTGSGFYIPIYISVDGTIIYFVCSGDSISGCGCLDISDYFIDQ